MKSENDDNSTATAEELIDATNECVDEHYDEVVKEIKDTKGENKNDQQNEDAAAEDARMNVTKVKNRMKSTQKGTFYSKFIQQCSAKMMKTLKTNDVQLAKLVYATAAAKALGGHNVHSTGIRQREGEQKVPKQLDDRYVGFSNVIEKSIIDVLTAVDHGKKDDTDFIEKLKDQATKIALVKSGCVDVKSKNLKQVIVATDKKKHSLLKRAIRAASEEYVKDASGFPLARPAQLAC